MNATRWGWLLGVLAIFLGLVWWVTRADEVGVLASVAEPMPAVQPVVAPERVPSTAARPPDQEVPTPSPDSPPAQVAAPLALAGRATPRPPKHPVDAEAFAREGALLEQAKLQVKTDPELALRSLLEHWQLFPQSERNQDFELVRLEAFLRLGRRADAERLGQKLTARDGAARKSVERLLNDVQPH